MKRLLILFLLISSIVHSQIQVKTIPDKVTIGKVGSGGGFIAELYYTVSDTDTTYYLMYNNFKYTHITDIQSVSFSSVDGTLEKLYSIMKSIFLSENKKNKDYKVALKLGSDDVVISNNRLLGVTQLMFYTPKGYFLISEKQVDKLFDKRD